MFYRPDIMVSQFSLRKADLVWLTNDRGFSNPGLKMAYRSVGNYVHPCVLHQNYNLHQTFAHQADIVKVKGCCFLVNGLTVWY